MAKSQLCNRMAHLYLDILLWHSLIPSVSAIHAPCSSSSWIWIYLSKQGHEDYDVPLASAYSHGLASQTGRKAEEEDVDDSQAVATSGGMSRSRS
ncbi:hypothetical protein EV421DRAFT_1451501 [Armillaria borealis]|uniref:Uncharacterized protein n=1 Tax=Armillaria borealis TaxID=47425 RepID=A0AA39MGG8_9AGAR|nr:hypothetical protein EV421DRAFT_1451501 [Armillaria borealis]